MSDTWSGSTSTSWFNSGNWSTGAVPAISATGTQSVVINGTHANQPVIPFNQAEITVEQTVYNNGTVVYTALTETQIGGENITLTNGADLTIQGNALGIFYGNADTITATGGTISGLHGATSSTPSFDSHMSVIAIGNDTLTVETVNENFGLISIGNGDTLTIYNTYGNGSNPQALHGLINYGLITVATGGHLNISAAGSTGSTVANFYNAGWIEVDGGTLSISSSVLDGSNTLAGAGTTDGYIEIGGGGDAILSSTVAASEQINFTDSASNTLQITAGTLFSGTVNNFGAGDTIVVNGFTSTSNATITTVGGVTELITTNGTVLTTITLTGSINSNFTTGTNSSGQEVIVAGGNTLSSNTTYASGSNTLTGTGGSLTNNSTVAVSGPGTVLDLASTVTGTGEFFIDYGATLALTNATGNDAGQTASFGTHGSVASPNTLLVNDNSSGFGGHVTGFGANDDIVLGGSVLPALSSSVGITESYSGGVLTVSETSNSTGSVVSSTALTIAGAATFSTASFVALDSSAGVNIELAPTAATTYSFSAASTGSFEDYHNYTGGIAPGDVLSPNTTVAIGTGTASVASGGVTDNGLITISSGATFLDGKSLSGTGALGVASGGNATLTGTTNLGSITDAGTLTLGGTDAVNISLATGAQVTLAANFTDTSVVTGAGTLTVNSGVTGSLASGSSITSVLDEGRLNLGGSFSGTINMENNGAGSIADFIGADVTTNTLNATLTSFGTGDELILSTTNFATSAGDTLTKTYTGGILTVTDAAHASTIHVTLGVTTGDATSGLTVSDSTGQLVITLCFYPGTALATPGGEIKVEDIVAGDLLMTANGAMPVRWIGQSHVHTSFADPVRSLPIRIRQGALGDGLPVRDLLLSPDHAIHLDGILVQAGALVNGETIIREYDVPEQFTYFHVELDSHELLLAENVLAESFVDNIDRMHFQNWDDRAAPAKPIIEMDLPRAKSARQLPQAIRRRFGLNKRAVA